jgi:hypothetical protein
MPDKPVPPFPANEPPESPPLTAPGPAREATKPPAPHAPELPPVALPPTPGDDQPTDEELEEGLREIFKPPEARNGHGPDKRPPVEEGTVPPPAPPKARPRPPAADEDALSHLQGEVGLIFRELGDINASLSATRLLATAAFALLLLATGAMIMVNVRARGELELETVDA